MNILPKTNIYNKVKIEEQPSSNRANHITKGIFSHGQIIIKKDLVVNGTLDGSSYQGSGVELKNISKWQYEDVVSKTDIYRLESNVSIAGNGSYGYRLFVNGSASVTDPFIAHTYGSSMASNTGSITINHNNEPHIHLNNKPSGIGFFTNEIDSNTTVTINATLITNNLFIKDEFYVNGGTTNIFSQTINVNDPLLLFASEQNGTPSVNTGFMVNRIGYPLNPIFMWDESHKQFVTIQSSSKSSIAHPIVDNYANFRVDTLQVDNNVTVNNYLLGNSSSMVEITQEFSRKFIVTECDGKICIDDVEEKSLFLQRGQKYIFEINTNDPFTLVHQPFNNTYATLLQNNIYGNGNTRFAVPPFIIFDVPNTATGSIHYTNGIGSFGKLYISDNIIYDEDENTHVSVENDIKFYTDSNLRLILGNDSHVGLNQQFSDPQFKLYVNGTSQFYGNIVPTSNNTQEIGIPTQYWNKSYINTTFIANQVLFNNTPFLFKESNMTTLELDNIRSININSTAVLLYESPTDEYINVNKWQGVDNIHYITSNVALGTSRVLEQFTVMGNVNVSQLINTSTIIINNKTITNPSWHNIPGGQVHYQFSNVGIGYEVPLYPIHVNGTTRATYLFGNGSQLLNLPVTKWQQTANDIYYSSGNISINTKQAIERLHVNGAINIGNTINEIPGMIRFNNGELEGFKTDKWVNMSYIGVDDRDNNLWNKTGPDNMISFAHQIGINTDSPTEKLTVNGTVNVSNFIILKESNVTPTAHELNVMDGIISNVSELNTLYGITAITDDINRLNASQFGIATVNTTLIPDINNNVNLDGGKLTVNDITITNNVTLVNQLDELIVNNFAVNDSILHIARTETGTYNSGFVINRGEDNTVGFIWNEIDNEFVLIDTTNETGNINNYQDIHVNNTTIDKNINSSYYKGNAYNLQDITPDYIHSFNVGISNNMYVIDDVVQSNITLVRGQRYRFKLHDVIADEPFFIGMDNITNHAYLTGVTGNGSTQTSIPPYLIFDVPHTAPGNLYYKSGNTVQPSCVGAKIFISGSVLRSSDREVQLTVEESYDEDRIRLYTSNKERLIITPNKWVGVNTSTPTAPLDINGGYFVAGGDIIPHVNNTYNIGNESLRWEGGYINDLIISNNSLFIGNKPTISSNAEGDATIFVDEVVTTEISATNIELTVNNQIILINKWKGDKNIGYINGNVGIRVLNPRELLDITGIVNVSEITNSSKLIVNGTTLKSMSWVNTTTGHISFADSYIGIQTDTPQYTLDVSGNVSAPYFIGNGSLLEGLNTTIWTETNNGLYYANDVNYSIGRLNNIPLQRFEVNGGIWIGNTTHEINGSMRFTGIDLHGYKGNRYKTLISLDNGNNVNNWKDGLITDDIYYTLGNVGIGTVTPNHSLDIIGNMKLNGNLFIKNNLLQSTATDLNLLDGSIVNSSDLNRLTGILSSTGELNKITGLTPTITEVNKPILVDESHSFDLDTGNLIVGNMTVLNKLIMQGNRTILHDGNLIIGDSLFTLAEQQTLLPTRDGGYLINRTSMGNCTGVIWDESADEFALIHTGDNECLVTDNVVIENYANLRAHDIYINGSVTASHLIGNGTYLTSLPITKWTGGETDINFAHGNISIGTSNVEGTFTLDGLLNIAVDETHSTALQIKSRNVQNNFDILHVDNMTGNVGFGNINPKFTVDINNSLQSNQMRIGKYNNSITSKLDIINNLSTDNLTNVDFKNLNNTSVFFINTTTGDIGIGTYNPTAKLHVTNNALVSNRILVNTTTPNLVEQLQVEGIINTTYFIGNGSDITGLIWKQMSNNLYPVDIEGVLLTGNIGVNTTTPQYKLDVQGRTTANEYEGNASLLIDVPTAWKKKQFKYLTDISRMGKVGIRTSNPMYTLDVEGDIKADVFIGDGRNLTNLPNTVWSKLGTTLENTDTFYIGNVGMNTSISDNELTVNNSMYIRTTPFSDVLIQNQSKYLLHIDSSNRHVGIHQSADEYNLSVNGTVHINSSILGENNTDINSLLSILVNTTTTSTNLKNVLFDNFIINSTSGNVGINILSGSNPTATFEIIGNVTLSDNLFIGGVSNPNMIEKLQVNGIANTTGLLIGNGSQLINPIWKRNPLFPSNVYLTDKDNNLSNGNIGIGVLNPSDKLTVSGDITATHYYGNGSGITGIENEWVNIGNDIHHINTFVGINTTTPQYELDVQGTLKVNNLIGDGSSIVDFSTWNTLLGGRDSDLYHLGNISISTVEERATLSVNNSVYIVGDNDNTIPLQISSNNIPIVSINAKSNSLSINNVIPKTTLDVNSSMGVNRVIVSTDLGTNGAFDIKSISGDYNTNIQIAELYTNTVTGYFGINTSIPQYTLDINGNVLTDKIIVNMTQSDSVDKLHVSGSVNATYIIGNGSQITGQSWVELGGNIYFANHMDQLSLGNVGVNVTTPNDKLVIVGDTSATLFKGNGSNLTDLPLFWKSNIETYHSDISYMLGNVGIGTITPNATLDVVGVLKANKFYGDGGQLDIDNGKWKRNENDLYHTGSILLGSNVVENELHALKVIGGVEIVSNTTISGYDNVLDVRNTTTDTPIFNVNYTTGHVGVMSDNTERELNINGAFRVNNTYIGDVVSTTTNDISAALDIKVTNGVQLGPMNIKATNRRVDIGNVIGNSEVNIETDVSISNKLLINRDDISSDAVQINGTTYASNFVGNTSLLTGYSWLENTKGDLYHTNLYHEISTDFTGIKNINPAAELDVYGTVNTTQKYIGNGSLLRNVNSVWQKEIEFKWNTDISYSTGNVGINNSNPQYTLDVNGEVNCSQLDGFIATNDLLSISDNITIPHGRANMTSILNGEYAIFAGGEDISNLVNIYNVETNIWTETTMSNAKTHISAIVSGDEIVLAGGDDGVLVYNSVDIFNVKTLNWSHATLSLARTRMGAIGYGNIGMFVGGTDLINPVIDIDVYESTNKLWYETTLNSARYGMESGILNGVAYFAGGLNPNLSNKIDVYNFNTNKWSYEILGETKSDLNVVATRSSILFAGGKKSDGEGSTLVDKYCSIERIWTQSTLSVGRYGLSGVNIGDMAIFVGGNGVSNIVDIYDDASDIWFTTTIGFSSQYGSAIGYKSSVMYLGGDNLTVTVNKMNSLNYNKRKFKIDSFGQYNDVRKTKIEHKTTSTILKHEVTTIGATFDYGSGASLDNYVLFGTGSKNGSGYTDELNLYNGNDDSWSIINLSLGMEYTTIVGANDKFYIAGGKYAGTQYNSVSIYNINTHLWETQMTLSVARDNLSSGKCGNYLFFAGGYDGIVNVNVIDIYDYVNDIWSIATLSTQSNYVGVSDSFNSHNIYFAGDNNIDIYNVKDKTWSSATLSNPRNQFNIIEARNNVIFAGGYNGNVYVNTVDIYNKTTGLWSESTLSDLTGSCNKNAAGFGDIVAIFCGTSNTLCNIVDIFDDRDSSWTHTTVSVAANDYVPLSIGHRKLLAFSDNNVDIFTFDTEIETISIYTNNSVEKMPIITYDAILTPTILSYYLRETNVFNLQSTYKTIYGDGKGLTNTSFVRQQWNQTSNLLSRDVGSVNIGGHSGYNYTERIVTHVTENTLDILDNTRTFSTLSVAMRDLNSISLNGYVLFAGGRDSTGTAKYNNVDIYNYNSNVWTYTILSNSIQQGRIGKTNNKIYIVGGTTDITSKNVHIFDTRTENWVVTTLSGNNRVNLTIGSFDNVILFAGGSDIAGAIRTNILDIYDENTDLWTESTISQSIINGGGAGAYGKILIGGGETDTGIVNDLNIYDVTSGELSLSTLNNSIQKQSVIGIDDEILFMGGLGNSSIQKLASTFTHSYESTLSVKRGGTWIGSANGITIFAGGNGWNDIVDIYNANTDTWTTNNLNTAKSPVTHGPNGAAVIGDNIYIGGGRSSSGQLNNVDVFNTLTNTWTFNFHFLSQKREQIAVAYSERYIIFAGGNTGTTNSTNVDIYDSLTDTWYVKFLSEARRLLDAVYINNKFYVIGGFNNSNQSTNKVDVLDVSDINNMTWNTLTIPNPVHYVTAQALNDSFYIIGGANTFGSSYINNIEIYNTLTDTWTSSTLSESRRYVMAESVGNILLIAGGFNSSGYINNIEIYNSDTDEWSESTLNCIFDNSLVKLDSNRIIGGGGSNSNPSCMTIFEFDTIVGHPAINNTIDIYNVKSDTWNTKYLNTARYNASITSFGKYACIAGGRTDETTGLADTMEIYDTDTCEIYIEPTNKKLYGGSVVGFKNKLMIAGGALNLGSNTVTNEIEIYDFQDITMKNSKSTILDIDNWSLILSTLSNSVKHSASILSGDYIVYSGGENIYGVKSNLIEMKNIITNKWLYSTLSTRVSKNSIGATKGVFMFTNENSLVNIWDSNNNTWKLSTLSTNMSGDKVCVGGGKNILATVANSNKVDIYDINNNTWILNTLSINANYSKASVGNNKIIAFAGGRPLSDGINANNVNNVDIYDIRTKSWSVHTLSDTLADNTATIVNNKLIISGGYDATGSASDKIDMYNIDSGNWTHTVLNRASGKLKSGVVNNLAVFAGGTESGNQIEIYDDALCSWFVSTLEGKVPVVSESVLPEANLNNIIGYDNKLILSGELIGISGNNNVGIMTFPYRSISLDSSLRDNIGSHIGINGSFCSYYDVDSPAQISYIEEVTSEQISSSQFIGTLSNSRIKGGVTSVGGVIISAGGRNNGYTIIYNTIDIYDSYSDVWEHSTLEKPVYDNTAISYEGKSYIVGGTTGRGALSNNVDIYNTANKSWTHTTISEARSGLSSTEANGKLIFAGGCLGIADSIKTVEYTTLSEARFDLFGSSVGHIVVIAGGENNSAAIVDTLDVYNDLTTTWTTSVMPTPLYNNDMGDTTSASVGNEIFFGGGNLDTSTVEIYNTNTNTWRREQLSAGRNQISHVSNDRYIVFAGGKIGATAQTTVDIYDTVTRTWNTTNLSRIGSGMTGTSIGNVFYFVLGKEAISTVVDIITITDITDITTSTETLPTAQNIISATSLNGKAYFIGGYSSSDVYIFDGVSWTTDSISVARHGISSTSVNNILIACGGYAGGFRNDVDIYNSITGNWIISTLSNTAVNCNVVPLNDNAFMCSGGLNTTKINNVNIFRMDESFTNKVDIYQPVLNKWTQATLSLARSDTTSVSCGKYVFIAGGRTNTGNVNNIDIYHSIEGTWGTATLSYVGRNVAAAATDNYVMFSSSHDDRINNVDILNINTFTWTHSTLSSVKKGVVGYSLDDIIMFIGGSSVDDTSDNTVDIYNTITDIWTESYINNRFSTDVQITDYQNNGLALIGGAISNTYSTETNLIEVIIFNTNSQIVSKVSDLFKLTNKDSTQFIIDSDNFNIGIDVVNPVSALTIGNGNLRVTDGEFIVESTTMNIPDYVFEQSYTLMPIDDLRTFVKTNKHLPNMFNQKYISNNGIPVNEMNMRLLEKIEEMTLYTIQQNDELKTLIIDDTECDNELEAIKQEQLELMEIINNR
jgi:hypothetical protein